jgi:hypothetical protein
VFELRNQSPFNARLLPSLAVDGAETALVVVKGTYEIPVGTTLRIAAQQVPLTFADEYYGDPEDSSIRYASDIVPEKRGTDVVLIGRAHAVGGDAISLKVTLEAGPLRSALAVVGDRHWQKSTLLGLHASNPIPFVSMPLVYERAFGGNDRTHQNPNKWAVESRNPVGRGLIANPARPDLANVLLPNLEDPADLVVNDRVRPKPVGFGYIAPGWVPRVRYTGTYDERWRETRFPLLPVDFDPRFYNSAHPDLISPSYFVGGEKVRVTNASRDGILEFHVPEVDMLATFYIDGRATEKPCNLDTIVIEPDQRRFTLTWRASANCHRKVKYVTGARIVHSNRRVNL